MPRTYAVTTPPNARSHAGCGATHPLSSVPAGASIPLNAIAPGVIVTPMGGDYISTPEGRAAMVELVPMPRQGPLDGYGSPEHAE